MKKYYLMAVAWIGKDGKRILGFVATIVSIVSFLLGLITGLIL